jgi:O-antigen/teichoic acid export membrane protein
MQGEDKQVGHSLLRPPVAVQLRHLFFLANFILAKGTVYLMPLALAAVASAEFYGGIELALSIGLQACAILLGAPLAGITQVYLIKRDPAVGDLLLFLTFISALLLLLLTGILWLAGTGMFAVLTVSVLSVTVIQNTGSVWFRMRGERNRTAWADSAAILLAGLVAIGVVVAFGSGGTGIAAGIFALLTGLTALLSGAALLRHRVPDMRARLARASRIGLPMMVAGVFAIWLGVGGRILVGITSPSDLAAYSLAFRVAGLAFGVHQLATTAAFPLLYATRTRQADRLLAMFMTAVLATTALLALAGPFIVDLFNFSALGEHDKATFKALVPLTSFQTFFWIGFALLQFRINRSGVAKSSIAPTLFVTAGGIGIILLVARFVSSDVRLISVLIALHSVAYFAMAWLVLARRRLPYRYVGFVGLAGGVLLGAIAALTV